MFFLMSKQKLMFFCLLAFTDSFPTVCWLCLSSIQVHLLEGRQNTLLFFYFSIPINRIAFDTNCDISFLRVDERSLDSFISPDYFFQGKVLKCSSIKRGALILINAHVNALRLICLFQLNSSSFARRKAKRFLELWMLKRREKTCNRFLVPNLHFRVLLIRQITQDPILNLDPSRVKDCKLNLASAL